MHNSSRMNRRKFIQVTTVAAAGSMVGCTRQTSPWRFFTVQEGQTLAAICERLIPSDQDPGAQEAGVPNFIDLQLMGPYQRHRSSYRQGLKGVEKASLDKFGHGFSELRPEQQDAILEDLERGSPAGDAWKNISSREFFALILSHTMQGYYGDPRHGGNRGRASWKMLGLPYPPIRGRSHYDLTKPEGKS